MKTVAQKPVANKKPRPAFVSTRNACRVCTPFGACLAFKGIEGAVPLLHGSQGCATYIRRYMISHYKEPVDVASSNFSESSAVFGGAANLKTALANVIHQYHPKLIGVATTCLSETIGDDVPGIISEFERERLDGELPPLVHVSTPSYSGTHDDGFHATLRATVETLSRGGETENRVNVMSGIVSPADLRHLKDVLADFGVTPNLLPDYSDTLDGPAWDDYQTIPPGGTLIADIERMGRARATIEFSSTADPDRLAGASLLRRHNVPRHILDLPIGVRMTDKFVTILGQLTGLSIPAKHAAERGRLIDSFVDGHKHVFGRRAVVYGEEDLVVGLASLLTEVGIVPAVCASGGTSGRLAERLKAVIPDLPAETLVLQNVDFAEIEEHLEGLSVDLLIGSSKGYPIAKKLNVPLVRVGFPIHDRLGGARLLHLGYAGAQQLFDRIADAILESKQNGSSVGYAYM